MSAGGVFLPVCMHGAILHVLLLHSKNAEQNKDDDNDEWISLNILWNTFIHGEVKVNALNDMQQKCFKVWHFERISKKIKKFKRKIINT